MPWITVIWSMIASACITLAAIYGFVWYRNRTAWAHLLFAATAASTAVFTFDELSLMRAETPAQLLMALKWGHLALLFWIVSIIWFVRLHLGAGRLWLAGAVCVLRALYLVPTFLIGPSFLYREITSLRRVPLLGEHVTIFTVITSPWMLVGQVINLMVIVFVADASITAWRRGERRKALIVGGAIELFVLLAMLESALIYWAQAPIPIVLSPFYLGTVAVMGYEISRDVSREIAARKRAEQETHQLRQELAHAGRVSTMGQLAASLAHEINQPLGAILRNAEAAQLFLAAASPDLDEVRAILADIRADDERAGSVIDRMRGLLKRQALDKQPLDLRGLAGEVAALVRVDAAARQVELDVDVPGDVPQVQGDRVHLQQVLLNLILNGMDALNGASPEHRRISVSVRRDAQAIEIAVSDAGPGIPAAALSHIFEPFYTTKPDGMGMGLAISRTIIEAHGGRLWAENKAGGGAAFRFTLPIAEEDGPR